MNNLLTRLTSVQVDRLYLIKQFNRRILIDIPSGLTHPISEAAWEIIYYMQNLSNKEALSRYTFEQIEQAVREIEEKVHLGYICTLPPKTDDDFCPNGLLSVLMNITHKCNLACKYCIMGMPSLKDGYKDNDISMSLDTALKAVDYIRTISVKGVNLTFFGGEPLIEFDNIKKIVEYTNDKYPGWFRFNIITNGTLLRDDMLDFFQKNKIEFLFSIDGDQEINDKLRVYKYKKQSVFTDAFSNLTKLAAHTDINYKVNITYFKPTINIADSFDFFCSQKIPETRFERGLVPADSPFCISLTDIDYVKNEFSQMAQDYYQQLINGSDHIMDNFVILIKKITKNTRRYRGCNMGIDFITIAADGKIYPCHKMVGNAYQNIGSVENGVNNTKQREIWQQNVLQRPVCSKCWAKFLCGGFCISDNYHVNGDYFTPVRENCEIMKHNIKLALWLYYELDEQAPQVLKRIAGQDYLQGNEIPVQYTNQISWRDESRIYNKNTGAEYQLNGMAGRMFDLCDGNRNIESIARALSEECHISYVCALYDVRSQISAFYRAGLIKLNHVLSL